MKNYSLTHLTDGALLSGLTAMAARDRDATADLLAHIAEVDARKLYAPAGHPSMHSYCVLELKLSEQAAYKRITVARLGRRFLQIFAAIADGRLNLTSVTLLARRLTEETAAELLEAAAHKSKAEIEELLAHRFPRPDLATRVEPVIEGNGTAALALSTGPCQLSPERVEDSPARVAPLASRRYGFQFTMGEEGHDLFEYVRDLLGRSFDIPEVFERALQEMAAKLEKQKFAATDTPRKSAGKPSANPRHIPARVKREVCRRDGGQCTFTTEGGKRCPARSDLQFDHVLEVARGGEASVANLRLLCRAHNQLAAEQAFGAEFMANKREEARRETSGKSPRVAKVEDCGPLGNIAKANDAAAMSEPGDAEARAKKLDVVPWLRALGFRATEARRAAELCEAIPDATLEDRVRFALSALAPRTSARPLRA